MRHIITALASLMCIGASTTTMATTTTVSLRLVETSDVHGCYFPYNFIERTPMAGSLARTCSYIKQLREEYGDRLILLENGDILQGQPTCYYTNFIDTLKPNIAAEIVNYMGYDATSIGNHDIEPGHAVYDKWMGEMECPAVGANIIDTSTGEPYVKPYVIIEREGVRIAVMGLLTPAVPNWLNETIWSGLRFDDLKTSAAKWMDYIRDNEAADVVVGLFHTGWQGGIKTDDYCENAVEDIAKSVDGFDIIFFGHDHQRRDTIVNGVVCLNPANNARAVAEASVSLTIEDGKVVDKKIDGKVTNICDQEIDIDYIEHFYGRINEVRDYVGKKIGVFADSMLTRDCFFGSAPFTDFIHNMQLAITGADISLNAPLSFDAKIKQGDLYMSDMFKLYRYENKMYVVRMTGAEVRRHLEMSYDQWVNTMQSADDHIMLIDKGDDGRYRFKNMTFNFDSAAGIDYEVDVTRPDGEKVRILRMSNGEEFREDKWYDVVMNSYRGNGGGELLTRGAGIPKEELQSRIIFQSDLDQRYYLTREIEKAGTVTPAANNNWRFVPQEWAQPAIERDRILLFGE